MRFSVIIPYYKDFERLLLLLEHLNNQTIQSKFWQAIVVNNDPDLPLKLPEGFSVSYCLNLLEEPTPGSYAARNKGISQAKGEILAFTDSDCLPDPDWLKNAWELFLQDSKNEIGVLTGPVPLFFKNPKSYTDAEVYEKYTGFTTESYEKEGYAITANWFSYKSVIEEFGSFDSELKSNGDSDLSGKISRKYRIDYSSEIKVMHPARFETGELVNKYKRLLGGAFVRRFHKNPNAFRNHAINFILKRYRFALKKLVTVSPKESWAILKVCHAINRGALKEYYNLIQGGETKR